MTARQSYFLMKEKDIHPYPIHRLKRVEKPTINITNEVKRFDEREHGFNRALRGDFGPRVQMERMRMAEKYPLSASLSHLTEKLQHEVDGEIAPEKAPLPEDPFLMSLHIKRLAYFLRADLVGIAEIPPYAVYSHKKDGNPVELDHKYAIVMLIDQDYDTFNGSDGKDWISTSQSFLSYSASALLACAVAGYIRRLGYPARAHHARDYQVVVPPLLLWAGLGEWSRMGIVLNPFLGHRFKASVVTTNLLLQADKPVDFGLQTFCQNCKKCSRECPSASISQGDKVFYNGYETWKADTDLCTRYRLTNPSGSGCGRCIKVCPWNKKDTWYHRASIEGAKRSILFQKFLIWIDDVLGYGKPVPRDKWWFDLESMGGSWKVPANKA